MKANPFGFLLLSPFIFSCKGDDATIHINYPSTYYKAGLKASSHLWIFSSNGIISDQSVISRFTEYDTANFSRTAHSIITYAGVMDTIRFSDPQHAAVSDQYQQLECIVGGLKNDRLILTRTDIRTGNTIFDELTHNIIYYIGQVKPEVFTEYLVSSVRGNYQFGYTAKENFVLEEISGQLAAPVIQFSLHRLQRTYGGYVNNVLQKDFYKELSTSDTVTLREYRIFYEN